MMRAAFAFLILALPAVILGVTGLAGTSSVAAQMLLLALMVMSLLVLMSGQQSTRDATDRHASTSAARVVMALAAGRTAATTRTVDAGRLSTVREAFHQQRLAHVQRRLSMFYLEHNLFEQARDSRLVMIAHLRGACRQWRRIIGVSS